LESTTGQLDLLVESLSAIAQEAAPQVVSGPVDWQQVGVTLTQLRGALENYDARARDLIKQLSKELSDQAYSARLKAIEQVVDNYEFDIALEQLGELEALLADQSASRSLQA
jgi:hypothetical protein